jgi:arylsulfatase A-like enzyme
MSPDDPPPSLGEPDVSDTPAWVRSLPALGPRARSGLTEAERRSLATLLAVDDAVAAILDALRERGDLEHTVVVFVSDNGFSFGEHRWVKKACPYEACVSVPLLIRYPPAGPRVEPAIVSTVDLAPTIAALAGLDGAAGADGVSLVPLLEGDAAPDRPAYLELPDGAGRIPPWWQVRTAGLAYIELATGERELYDLRRDPDQLSNVAEDPAYATAVARLAAELARFRDG